MVADGNLSNADEGCENDNHITVDEVFHCGEVVVVGGHEGGEIGGVAEDGKSVKIGVQDEESQGTLLTSEDHVKPIEEDAD
jgi:ribosomal protein L21E